VICHKKLFCCFFSWNCIWTTRDPSEHSLRSTALERQCRVFFQNAAIVRGGIGWMHDGMGCAYLVPYVMSYCKTVSWMLGKFKRLELQGWISFDIHVLVWWFISVLLKLFVHYFLIEFYIITGRGYCWWGKFSSS
jgi:hypothetical protein